MDFQEKLVRYADLVVTHGMHVQKGQLVNVKGEIAHREFLFQIARAAYEKGAKHVQIDYLEPRLQKVRHQISDLENLSYVPKHVSTRYNEILDNHGATVSVVGPEAPDLFSDLDPVKVNTSRMAGYQAVKRFYDDGIGKSLVQWSVVAGATTGWAKKVFPDLPEEKALAELWEVLFRICRVDKDNYLELWREHNSLLHKRAADLTDLKIEKLRFLGPGTDLTVGLSDIAIFKGGTEQSPSGMQFEPNLPTEECFTTPDYRKTEGTVSATRPVYINGKLVEGLKMTFTAGEITDFSARSGESTFKEYISSDEGARRLGEVALVGIDSPIYQSGLVFQEILLDENAACHIAIGSAYKFCLSGGEKLSSEELANVGCNESCVHTDIMISSEEVDVVAVAFDGTEHSILKSGKWDSRW